MSSKQTKISSVPYAQMFEGDKNYTRTTGSIIIAVLFCILSLLVGFFVGDSGKLRGLSFQRLISNETDVTSFNDDELKQLLNSNEYDLDLYKQIAANLKSKYVDLNKVDDKKLFEGSLKGLVDAIGDKATNYFSADDYKKYLDSFSGKFQGIGVRLEYSSNVVGVANVFPDSPAEKAGVKSGFLFNKVDGKDVTKSNIEDITALVRGDAGTKVAINFFDPFTKTFVDKEITRADIEVASMRLVEKDKDTVVFEISRFLEPKLEQWNAEWDNNVSQILAKGYKNIILDLRNNGGGYLEAAIHAANDFLEPKKLIVSERSRIRPNTDTYSTKVSPRLKNQKVVILINENTASASEILAGALKYNNRATILGVKSFGKGTVQNTYNLPDGGALKITTEYWLLPDGKRLDNDNPISPDIEIKQIISNDRTNQDNVMDEALKKIKE